MIANLASLALPLLLAVAAPAPARAVPPTGHYVYTLRPSVRIEPNDTPAKELRKAAAVFWPGESRIAAVLTGNGIADESRLKFGTVLRMPPPSQASALSRCFEAGLELEVGKGDRTVRLDCDPCSGPDIDLRMTDVRKHTGHFGLEPIPDSTGGAAYDSAVVTDVRAWDLPDGDMLLAVRSQDATGNAGRDVVGGIAFYRLGAGPRAELLASLPGDRSASTVGRSSHEDCSLSGALEGRTFVLTVVRVHRESGAERRADQAVVRYSNEIESRQRLACDAAHHPMHVGPIVEVARRHKRWAEGEPEPVAFTEDRAGQ